MYDDYWYEDPKSILVFVDEVRESLVLDQTGTPYKLHVKNSVGFDLAPKTDQPSGSLPTR